RLADLLVAAGQQRLLLLQRLPGLAARDSLACDGDGVLELEDAVRQAAAGPHAALGIPAPERGVEALHRRQVLALVGAGLALEQLGDEPVLLFLLRIELGLARQQRQRGARQLQAGRPRLLHLRVVEVFLVAGAELNAHLQAAQRARRRGAR